VHERTRAMPVFPRPTAVCMILGCDLLLAMNVQDAVLALGERIGLFAIGEGKHVAKDRCGLRAGRYAASVGRNGD